MSKITKKKKTFLKYILLILAALLVIIFLIFVFVKKPKRSNSDNADLSEFSSSYISSKTENSSSKIPESSLIDSFEQTSDLSSNAQQGEIFPNKNFPLMFDTGNVIIKSIFQFSGNNPDCDNKEGENIAAIEFTNNGLDFLKKAEVTLTLKDGSKIEIEITNLPSGKSTLAFSKDNLQLTPENPCVKAEVKTSYEKKDPFLSDLISAKVDFMEVTLKNISNKSLKNIKVYCRCVMGDIGFGGKTYLYELYEIKPKEAKKINAVDCFQGGAELSLVELN